MESQFDEDILEDLKEISKQVQAVGRGIALKHTSPDELGSLAKALEYHAKTIRIYQRLQKGRDKERI